MTTLQAFLWGSAGSVVVELLILSMAINRDRDKASEAPKMLFPAYYKQPGFWAIRFLMTILAGAVAALEGAGNIAIAVNIGASVPAIISLMVSRWG